MHKVLHPFGGSTTDNIAGWIDDAGGTGTGHVFRAGVINGHIHTAPARARMTFAPMADTRCLFCEISFFHKRGSCLSPDMHRHQPFHIERLDPGKYRREDFNCESPELMDFLRKRARKEMQARASACFVLVPESDPGRIAGYYTLSQTAIAVNKLPETLIKKLPHYPTLGATLIGRLARDLEWKSQRLGRLLLIDALRRCLRYSNDVGAVVVVTDPKNDVARQFYANHGFRALDEHRMFIPMNELVQHEESGWTR